MPRRSLPRDVVVLLASAVAIAAVTAALRALPDVSPTTVALALLLVVLGAATLARLRIAIVVSVVAMLTLNFFFLPPVGTFTIADPQNWIALFAFLVVAVIASNLSAAAQDRAREAIARRNEVTRLFDLTRDVLLTTETASAIDALARHVARRFELPRVAICLPADHGWQIHQGGARRSSIDVDVLNTALAKARGTLEFDAHQRAYGGHIARRAEQRGLDRSAAARHQGGRPARGGLAGARHRHARRGRRRRRHRDRAGAVPGERDAAELVRQKADLAATLLASLSHDLRTPLTAIQVAVENLRGDLPAEERRAQAGAAMAELDRLTRLFQDILDMARIDAAAIRVDRQWVAAADVVDAAVAHVRHALEGHALRVDADADMEVEIDPRLASVALSHLLENAAQYSPAGPGDPRARPRRTRRPARLGHRPRARVSIPASSITCSSASTADARPGRRRSAPAWGSRSRADCWRQPAGGSGPRTCPAPARGSRSSCRAPCGRSRWRSSHGRRASSSSTTSRTSSAPWRRCCARAATRCFSAMTGRAALEAVERDKPDLIVLDLGLAGYRRRRGLPPGARDLERADPGALRARRRRRQGRGARRRRRRLRHQAVRRRGTAGAHPRGAAAGREPVARRASRSCAATW